MARVRQWTRLVLLVAFSFTIASATGCYYYHHGYGDSYHDHNHYGHYDRYDRGYDASYEADARTPAYRAPEPPPPPTTRRRRSPEG